MGSDDHENAPSTESVPSWVTELREKNEELKKRVAALEELYNSALHEVDLFGPEGGSGADDSGNVR